MTPLHLACAACGWTPGPLETDPYPFRCPRAGSDDGDHVVQPVFLTPAGADQAPPLRQPFESAAPEQQFDPESNPFIRYRASLYSWHVAQARVLGKGLKPASTTTGHNPTSGEHQNDADRAYCSLVERIDSAIEGIAGTGFRVTPCHRVDGLSQALGFEPAGGVWIKDETRNVSGSHKARHMMGVALYLEVLRHLGIDTGNRPLAVASCGNAALAAAVVARAIDRRLLVFVPEHAPATVSTQLEHLGATVTRCSRDSGLRPARSALPTPDAGLCVAGDPCYLAFRRAVYDGALPFSCQGNENGLVIEGGATVGYEIVEQLAARQQNPARGSPRSPFPDADSEGASESLWRRAGLASIDRLFVQVGGGALASACVRALNDSLRQGRLAGMPRLHAVQTCGGHPLKRAYDLLVARILERLAHASPPASRTFSSEDERAAYLFNRASDGGLEEAFCYARAHRSEFMWPWESEPRSIASGILDDETYDWAAVVEGMVRTGGFPIVVDETTLREANELARSTSGIDVDHTGSAGLAGLIALTRSVDRPLSIERIVVLFTGVRRTAPLGGGGPSNRGCPSTRS